MHQTLPYRGEGVGAMAKDRPYGRGSSTMGVKMTTLMHEFLTGAGSMLRRGGHLFISTPAEVDVEGYAGDGGLTVKEQHLVRVHRSLTRRFAGPTEWLTPRCITYARQMFTECGPTAAG